MALMTQIHELDLDVEFELAPKSLKTGGWREINPP